MWWSKKLLGEGYGWANRVSKAKVELINKKTKFATYKLYGI